MHSQHGYVLVMALLLIAMAGSVLVIMARRNVFEASDVKHAEFELKQRWATYSLSRSLLPQAGELIKTFEEDNKDSDKEQPLKSIRFEVELGQTKYQMIVYDEQAKADVNQLLKNKSSTSDTAQAIRKLMEDSQIQNVPTIELKPYTWEKSPEIAKVYTLGQVFNDVNPSKLLSTDPEQPAVLDELTCWTDGKINFHTASPEALKAVCTPLVTRGQIDKLIAARKNNPEISLDAALTAAGIAKNNLEKIKPLFTDQSIFYSVWVTAQTDRKTQYWLTIAQQQKTAKKKTSKPLQPEQDGKLMMVDFEW